MQNSKRDIFQKVAIKREGLILTKQVSDKIGCFLNQLLGFSNFQKSARSLVHRADIYCICCSFKKNNQAIITWDLQGKCEHF